MDRIDTLLAADTRNGNRVMNRAARLATDLLDPKSFIVACCLLIGLNHGIAGIAWGAELVLFAAVLPLAFITHRSGSWRDRHVPDRAERMTIIPVILLSVGLGVGLMWWGGGPRELLALAATMFLTLALVLVITAWWKISVHTAVGAGAIAILAVSLSAWFLIAYPVVWVVGWSRAKLQDHTVAQTIAGTLLGAVVAGPLFALLR
jgi:hypothetical protein